MKHLMSGVVQLLGSLFGVLVLAFTGYQTWMLLFEVSQNAIVATIGLILFEGGTIYWWSIFKSEAKGIMQMALSLLLFVFGLLLMVGSNGLHLGAIDPTFLGEKTPERLILVAAVISLVGKLLFPLLSPEMTQDIWRRALQGMLMVRALMKTEATIEEQSQRIANVLGADMARDVEMTLYTQYHIPHNLQRPALPAPDVVEVEGEVVRDVPRSQAKPPEPAKTAKSKGNASNWWQSFLAWVNGNQPVARPQEPAVPPVPDEDEDEDEGLPSAVVNARFKLEVIDPEFDTLEATFFIDTAAELRALAEEYAFSIREIYQFDGTRYVWRKKLPGDRTAEPARPQNGVEKEDSPLAR